MRGRAPTHLAIEGVVDVDISHKPLYLYAAVFFCARRSWRCNLVQGHLAFFWIRDNDWAALFICAINCQGTNASRAIAQRVVVSCSSADADAARRRPSRHDRRAIGLGGRTRRCE